MIILCNSASGISSASNTPILKEFGYSKDDFESNQNDQGFLDEHDNFYNRVEAWKHAYLHDQINPDALEHTIQELFSEDLW